jgi:uncharacterized protein related to proFAR isomerase
MTNPKEEGPITGHCCNLHQAKPSTLDSRIRDRFVRTDIDLLLIGIFLAFHHVVIGVYANEESAETFAEEAEHGGGGETEEEILNEEEMGVYAVLYPW